MQRHVITAILVLAVTASCGKKEETPAPTTTESAPPAALETTPAPAPVPTPAAAPEPGKEAPAAAPEPPPAAGAAELNLARKSGCLACHSVEKKVVGPAWKDVAARYRGNAGARTALIEKVKKGGKGNWTELTGGVPMPPYSPRVPDADIEALVDYVLTL
jgi:cytochrome c